MLKTKYILNQISKEYIFDLQSTLFQNKSKVSLKKDIQYKVIF